MSAADEPADAPIEAPTIVFRPGIEHQLEQLTVGNERSVSHGKEQRKITFAVKLDADPLKL
jgi:hypothetical protein